MTQPAQFQPDAPPHALHAGQPYCKACRADLSTAKSRGHKNGYDLLACPACETVTVNPFPTVEQLIAFYQSYKGTVDYRKKADRKIRRARRRLRRLMTKTAGRKLLDIGCNYGFTVKAGLDLGLEAFGIDIDGTAVAASQESFGSDKFRVVPVEDYAREGHQYDMIYTSEVIEHVPDPDGFVEAIAKLLAPGGIAYITTPENGHWRIPADFTQWDAVMPPEHITYFTRKGMKKLLENHGLKVEKFFFSLKPGMRLMARKA